MVLCGRELRRACRVTHNPIIACNYLRKVTLLATKVQLQITHIDPYLRVSKVDLHDESYSDSCGEGETSCDDDCQSISLAGTVFRKGVFGGLLQGCDIMASQVRGWGGETLEASRLQKQIWVCDKQRKSKGSVSNAYWRTKAHFWFLHACNPHSCTYVVQIQCKKNNQQLFW